VTVPAIRILIVTMVVIVMCSCGGPGERIKDIEAQKPKSSPTPTEREISGVFTVTGSAANEQDPYTGVLNVTPQGDVYSFRWQTSKGTRVGAGVQIGDGVAASFASPGSGKGCGVVLYKITSDGKMTGRIALWGEDKFATEEAIRTEGRTFPGQYQVVGTTSSGQEYRAMLKITKDGGGYDLDWTGLEKPFVAFGTWQGSYAAASFGGPQCGFALYRISGNDLDGTWGGQKAVTIGTETAKRQ